MKHIVFLASHFEPESNAGAKRMTALAKSLISEGWQVTVISQLPHNPQNVIYEGWGTAGKRTETVGALRVIRLHPWLVSKDNLVLRLLSEAYFVLKAFPFLMKERPTAYLASIPYMFAAPIALLAARLRSALFVLDVRDLTWQYPKAVGKRTFGLDWLLNRIMLYTAKRAALLTATTKGQLEHFHVDQNRALFLPNGVSREIFARLAELPPPRFLKGKQRPKATYVGLFGFNHNLEVVIHTARLRPDVDFSLVGDGPDREHLERAAATVPNVEILPYRPFDELVSIYSEADILISHFRKNPAFTVVQSAKVWEYMATGRPIIHATEGESVDFLKEHALGLAIEPDNPEKMAEAIGTLLEDRHAAGAMGRRAQSFVGSMRIREELFTEFGAKLRRLGGAAEWDAD